MKKCFVSILAFVLCATLLCGTAFAGNTCVETATNVLSGTVYSGNLSYSAASDEVYTGDDYISTYFAYVPNCLHYGERATAAPIMVVYGDQAFTEASVKAAVAASGLDELAEKEQAPVIFVNPAGSTWSEKDRASLLAVRMMFSDSTNQEYDAGEGKSEAGTYPGAATRLLVFAEGSGADFAYQYLAAGVTAKGQYFGTRVWKPTALFLMNPTTTNSVNLAANSDQQQPVYAVNASEELLASFKALNGDDAMTVSVTSETKTGFDKTLLAKGYDELLEHWFTRDNSGAVTLLTIDDYAKTGLTETRVDYVCKDKETVTYYSYIPNSVADKTDKSVPLFLIFHGSGNGAEFMTWSSGMDKLAVQEGFVVVSMDDYQKRTNAELMEAIEDFVSKHEKLIDRTRIYLGGYSMGSMKTASLGSEYTEYFAGSVLMNGMASPSENATGMIMPVFAFSGKTTHLQAFENPSSYPNSCIDYYFRVNGVTRAASFDDTYAWGTKPTKTESIVATDITNPKLTLTIDYFASRDGYTYTAFSKGDTAGHEPTLVSSTAAWNFLSQFSRNADGSIAINGEGSHTTATAGKDGCLYSETCQSAKLSDFKTTHWAHQAVDYVLEKGLMQGVGEGKFAAEGTVTRAMMAQLIYNLEGKPEVTGEASFTDVKSDAWYAKAVTWAATSKIVSGYGNGLFAPDAAVTREQMAVILYNYAVMKQYDTTQTGANLKDYTDYAKISSWAETALNWATSAGLMSGKGDNVLDPTGTATRAQVAQILMSFCEKIVQ